MNLQAMADNIPIPEDQINKDIHKITNTLSVYNTELQHPMIAHHAKRAHAYKVCCGPIQKSQMFDQYLANFDHESKQGYYMDRFLTNWFVIVSCYLKDK
jgi:hypothetical protein